MKVSFFPSATLKWPFGKVEIQEWLTTSHFQEVVNRIRESDNPNQIKHLKGALPAITPSGVFSPRQSSGLITPSNLICIDIDSKDNPETSADEMKTRITSNFNYVYYCGLSASGTGVFSIIRYKDFHKHKGYFRELEREFREIGLVVDSSCSDICRLRFASFDPNPFLNEDAEVFDRFSEAEETSSNIKPHAFSKKTDIERPVVQKGRLYTAEEQLLDPSNLVEPPRNPYWIRVMVDSLIETVCRDSIDITRAYKDWFSIACALNTLKGEAGREIFHNLSCFYPRYNHEEADLLFTSVLSRDYKKPITTLLEIARKYGVIC